MVFLLKQSCGAWRVRVPVGGSAGMQRIAALAYLLVWTWREHLRASERTRRKPAREVIFFDSRDRVPLVPPMYDMQQAEVIGEGWV